MESLPESQIFKNGLFKVFNINRYGKELTIENEFMALEELHRFVPMGFSNPVALLADISTDRLIGYISERIEGRTLSWYIKNGRRLPAGAFETADGMLRAANSLGMAHGDVHLANIMDSNGDGKFIVR